MARAMSHAVELPHLQPLHVHNSYASRSPGARQGDVQVVAVSCRHVDNLLVTLEIASLSPRKAQQPRWKGGLAGASWHVPHAASILNSPSGGKRPPSLISCRKTEAVLLNSPLFSVSSTAVRAAMAVVECFCGAATKRARTDCVMI